MNNHPRPVYEKPVYKIFIPVRDFSLDKAVPQFAAAIDAQIDCDDASADFIKEKLHSSTATMTRRYGVPNHDALLCLRAGACQLTAREASGRIALLEPVLQ